MTGIGPLTQIKADARKAAFARRKQAFDAGHSAPARLLSEVLAGHRGLSVAGYMPIRSEIDPRPAMVEAGAYGDTSVPVIIGAGQPLKFSRWTPDGPLRDGPFGAQVPQVDDWVVPDIVIVPLVAFTTQGDRLGYGGGFYDRTLEGLRARGAVLAIGFAWDAQQADSLPIEPTDQPLDMIVTPTQVLQLRG